MGPGFNAMNRVTVQQTSQGLAAYLEQQLAPDLLSKHGVVIGYDGRHQSRTFAHLAAAVFLQRGMRVHLFSDLVPTPWVAAGVAELGAAAGVMITASHNPKQDNGYKVYWSNGCQIIPPHDHGIATAITAHLPLWRLPSPEELAMHPLLTDPTTLVSQAYSRRLAAGVRSQPLAVNAAAQPVTYTPLHGVGLRPLLQAFQVMGLPPPHVVPDQAQPDPDFPTLLFPNPEEGAGTWAMAWEEGRRLGSRLVIANDPDADRLAAAERDPSQAGGWRAFTGNELGALLAHWLWQQHRAQHPEVPADRCVMLSSVVSSRFLGLMAAAEGFRFEQTLTGFKWLGSRALQLEEEEGLKVLLAYEEAIGFMLGAMYRDKDGIAAAAALCEMANCLYAQGSSLALELERLYVRYGCSACRSTYFLSDRPDKTRAVFDRLRQGGHYAQAIGGQGVRCVRDLGVGLDTLQPGGQVLLPWQPGDMMISYELEGGQPGQAALLTVRASGTEPKLKVYLEVIGGDVAVANSLADRLLMAVEEDIIRPEHSGLAKREK
ncbi:phosphoglucomutase [Haematococcus lacustris]